MHSKEILHLESMYLAESPGPRAHSIRLTLEAVPGAGEFVGTIIYDPNTCSLDIWGDRKGCTRMGCMSREIRATPTRTLDPLALGRHHYDVYLEGGSEVDLHLIEHRKARLWYLVIPGAEHRFHVVPLFASELFSAPSSETIGTVPIPE